MRARALIGAAVLVPVLAACGGGSSRKPKLASAQSTTTTTVGGSGAAPGSSTTVAGVGGGAPGGNQAGGKTGATQPGGAPAPAFNINPGPQDPNKPKPHATASLNRTCARRGIDPVTLTVHTEANGVAGYSTEYSDQSNSLSNKSYKTGDGYGRAGPDGVYTATWVVPATAPAGDAIVHVVAVSDVMPDLPLKIVTQTGTC